MAINVNLYYVHNKQNTNTHTLEHSITFQDSVNLETIVTNASNFMTQAHHDKTTKYIALK
jgi:hypothetical protein